MIEAYHDLLLAGDPLGEWAHLTEGMAHHNLRFGERYVCNVLRPMLLPRAQYEAVIAASADFYGAIGVLYEWLMADDTLRARMGLNEVEEAAIQLDPGYPSPDGVGRLDGFLDTAGTLRFVEYNADSPGGLAFGQALGALFMELPTMRRFAETHRAATLPPLDDLLQMLVSHYRAWGGDKRAPTIGIVDWEGLGTRPEFVLCQQHFERAGFPSMVTHPAALALRGGQLWDEESGKVIDIVYKRVLVGELLERLGLDNVLTETIRERAACVVNSFRAQLLFKKTLFALLSELADAAVERFTPAQRRAIHTHLPWTRTVRAGWAEWHGERVDLLEHVAANAERLVLKPNSEYGGKGVVLGWEVTPDEWQQALAYAAASPDPFVVQERIPLATQPFPLVRDGALRFEERFMDLDPYTFGPAGVRGAGVRLGATGLLNVTAGGGSAVPLVLVG